MFFSPNPGVIFSEGRVLVPHLPCSVSRKDSVKYELQRGFLLFRPSVHEMARIASAIMSGSVQRVTNHSSHHDRVPSAREAVVQEARVQVEHLSVPKSCSSGCASVMLWVCPN